MLKNFLGYNKFVFVDTETTGFSPYTDRIVEIAIVKIEGGQVVEKFETLVKPEIEVKDEVFKFTGIKKKEMKNAPKFADVATKMMDMFRGSLFVAHNSKFDYDFFEQEYLRHDMRFAMPQLCTVKLSRALFPNFQSHNLDSVTRRLRIEIKNRHRAMDDAFSLVEVLQKFQASVTQDKFEYIAKPIIVEPKASMMNIQAVKQIGLI